MRFNAENGREPGDSLSPRDKSSFSRSLSNDAKSRLPLQVTAQEALLLSASLPRTSIDFSNILPAQSDNRKASGVTDSQSGSITPDRVNAAPLGRSEVGVIIRRQMRRTHPSGRTTHGNRSI